MGDSCKMKMGPSSFFSIQESFIFGEIPHFHFTRIFHFRKIFHFRFYFIHFPGGCLGGHWPERKRDARVLFSTNVRMCNSISAPSAHFVSCVTAWAAYVEVAGSSPACGILAQMCECVIASMVRLWGWKPMGPKMAHFPPHLIAGKEWGEIEVLWRRAGGGAA